MFVPDFSLQAKMFQTVSEIAVTNFTNSVKMATDLMTAGLNSANMLSTPKTETITPPAFPTSFHYFPNLFQKEEKPQLPFSPLSFFESFQNKSPSFPMMGGVIPFPAFESPVNLFQKNSRGPSIKGFMMYFDIPLDGFKAEDFPWMNFPGLNPKS